jgi:hypothetical protein
MGKKPVIPEIHGEITPEDVFFNRREFVKTALGLGVIAGSTVMGGPIRPPSEEDQV